MATKTDKTARAPEAATSAFAPITETIEALRSKVEMPQAARDFVKHGVGVAQDRVSDLHVGAEKVTAAVETAALGTVGEIAKISRNMQQAYFDDVQAFFANLDKLASAKCMSEALQSQAEYLRGRGEIAVARAKSSSEYVGSMLQSGADKLRTGFADATLFGRKAA